jgi:hypothetical protein
MQIDGYYYPRNQLSHLISADDRLQDNSSFFIAPVRAFLPFAAGSRSSGAGWLNGGHVQERADFEFGRHAVFRVVDAHQYARPRQHRHLGVSHFVRLPARHDEPKWLKRLRSKQIAISLERHVTPSAQAP